MADVPPKVINLHSRDEFTPPPAPTPENLEIDQNTIDLLKDALNLAETGVLKGAIILAPTNNKRLWIEWMTPSIYIEYADRAIGRLHVVAHGLVCVIEEHAESGEHELGPVDPEPGAS